MPPKTLEKKKQRKIKKKGAKNDARQKRNEKEKILPQ
jgi:hypothetical protein